MNSSSLASRRILSGSLFRSFGSFIATLAFLAAVSSPARAGVAYDESINGDFSNSGLTATSVTLQIGSNQVFGTTGGGAAFDRDYFTVTIPFGYTLSSVIELPGTVSGGATSFMGLQFGSQVTLPTNTVTAAGLLGWTHYGPANVNADLLPLMAIPANGSSGFTTLGAGSYAFWVQDFNAGRFNYGFDLAITAAPAAVPEPSTYGLIGGALVLSLAIRRRFLK